MPTNNYSGLIQERNVLLEPFVAVYINNKRLDEDMMKYVQQVQVEDEEDSLPMASITVLDPNRVWLNDKGIARGSKVQINLGHTTQHRYMFVGKVTHIDAELPEEGYPNLTIVAMDWGISLMDDRQSRSFKNAKVSDVIKILLRECGLPYEVEDTGSILDYIPQESETNLEFITRWRKKLKWRFFKTSSNTYYFGKERNYSGTVKTLGYKTLGGEIVNFTPTYQDHEVSEEDNKQADVNNDGSITEYIVRDAKKTITYPGINDSSTPIGKA